MFKKNIKQKKEHFNGLILFIKKKLQVLKTISCFLSFSYKIETKTIVLYAQKIENMKLKIKNFKNDQIKMKNKIK